MPIETEIKIRMVQEEAEFHAFLADHGYLPAAPRQLESDTVYDRPDGELRTSARLLRLRREGDRFTLTYKGPPAQSTAHKSREEIETLVTDGTALDQILHKLGYEIVFRYEKYRTKFHHRDFSGLITFDETPIGNYIELEGSAEWIDQTAVELGYSAKDYIALSYRDLYLRHCQNTGTVPSFMTF